MRRLFCVAIVVCMASSLVAQYGGGVRYLSIQDGYLDDHFQGHFHNSMLSAYAMYWFRLKEKRVEFLPEIGYARSINSASLLAGPFHSMSSVSLQLNTDIYFLDFGNDCNCPTFSKQSNTINRGLFLEVSPGIEHRQLTLSRTNENNEQVLKRFSRTLPRVMAGLGFDIGVSELITITPIGGVGFQWYGQWDALEEALSTAPSSASGSEMVAHLGLRMLFRPDYKRRRR